MFSFNIPILLLTYKKDTALKVLEQIALIKPKKLYIASNHWKTPQESHTIKALRDKLASMITWNCEVDFLWRDKHLSCKESNVQSITYFFNKEEWGIVFDDDCVPTQDFFYFCEEMLKPYKDNQEVFCISGWSGLDLNPEAKKSLKEDYFFSKYTHLWGWASWRRSWQLYQKEFIDFNTEFKQLKIFDIKEEKKYWFKVLKSYSKGKIDTWDYPFTYSMWKHNALSIYPKNNMINNIGFNHQDAVHTTSESKFSQLKTYNNLHKKEMIHPKEIKRNIALDKIDWEISFKPPCLLTRIINKISRILFSKNLIKE
ncbi:methyltransferase FkbM [Helicobacter anatolicus]|uniref:methyltransferase FkbM n=1 Tax=Helicobacter anatolicus TaxID=2905874 RepID=UPI001E54AD7A|nr:methyltransferase FkbM [Helicobacter anatolicus]MCE3040293.1 methyltransferase FkbM [Helicobacter anatolicus]